MKAPKLKLDIFGTTTNINKFKDGIKIQKLLQYDEEMAEALTTLSQLNAAAHDYLYNYKFDYTDFTNIKELHTKDIEYIVYPITYKRIFNEKPQIIGYIYATIDKADNLVMASYGLPKAQINEIFILESYRGHGLAKRALRTACMYMRNVFKVTDIMVSVTKENRHAIDMYVKYNFHNSGINIGNDKIDIYIKHYNMEVK